MKKNITEELNRMKLFMGYNSKLTLKENESKLNINLLKEGKFDAVLRAFTKEFEPAVLKNAAKEAMAYDKTILKDLEGSFKNVEAVAKAFAEGTMKDGQALRVIKGFIDNPNIQKQLEERAIKIITNQEKFISKYENVSLYAKPEYMEKELVNRGYTKQQAEKLTKAFREERADFFKEPKPVKPEPVKPEPKPEPLKPTEPKKWTGKTWDWIKRNWKKLALGAGALWLLWYWFKDEQKIFPTCLLNLMSEEDLKKSSLGEGEIYVSKLNINDLDKLGGGKFSTNGDFESILGGYEGTWEKEGETFLIVVGSQNYTFECKDTTPPVPPPVPPKPEDNKCKTLPMKAGCIDDSGEGIINKIQECLGVAVTGKLDSATIQKLKEKYGVEILDQSTYDKIIKDCYETIDDRKFTEI